MQSGRIKWYNKSKAIGFIVQADGRDILVRSSSIKSQKLIGFPLKAGAKVRYKLREAPEGPEAYEVEPITESEASASKGSEL